jgi:hypothetical protein
MRRRIGIRSIGALLIVFSLVVAACNDDDGTETTAAPEPTATTAAPDTTMAEPMDEETPLAVPFLEAWEGSGHNDADAEAFRHWDEDDPMVVPAGCAKCHSAGGFADFLGVDGSAAGVVDADHAVDTTINCVTCHNEVTAEMDSVAMPATKEAVDEEGNPIEGADPVPVVIDGLGPEARCMQCHQGNAWGGSVDEAIAEAGVEDDVVGEDLAFINIHYFAAAATKYGTEAKGGYEYPGSTYDAFFTHVEGYESCVDCHNSHTLELKIEECATCHTGVASVEDVRAIRMVSSAVDYDGDGNMDEGIGDEIAGLQASLYEAIQAYAAEFGGVGIVYDDLAYPYFFIDTDADGAVTEGEAIYPNQYASWTPRLLKAAYNYQVSKKDPGGYAHGGKYIIQLLADSLADLNSVIASPVAADKVRRIDHGHFAGSEEAFRHWDEDGFVVDWDCSRCHTAEGLPLWLTEGVEISQPASNGLLCSTCHNDFATWSRYEPATVVFPSGAELDIGSTDGNLCMNCHQGRESTASVMAEVGDAGPNEVVEGLGFVNVHYFPAGATLFGSEAEGGFQYPGKDYDGRFEHVESYDSCTECHSAHALEVVNPDGNCAGCHGGTDIQAYRLDTGDYDGDGDTTEGVAGELEGLSEALYAAIQAYAVDNGLTGIIYDSHSYPYFFLDTDGDGAVSPGEAIYPNQYNEWTPALLMAAYNYQYAAKDPGAFAHNSRYVGQLLYDSIEAIGGDVSGLTRPVVTTE